VNEWTHRKLASVDAMTSGMVLVVDQDSLVSPTELSDQAEVANDWWSLRAAYERHGRRRPHTAPPLILILRPPIGMNDVPWDIQQNSAEIVAIRLPGPATVRAALLELGDDEFDLAAPAVAAATNPAQTLLGTLTGIALGEDGSSLADQLRIASRIALRTRPSRELGRLARTLVTDQALTGLLEVRPDCSALQQIWIAFIAGRAGE
jgi:hypothetical protein